MFTGYSDWRGKRMFFDTQVSVGYASLKGKRKIDIYSDDDTADTAGNTSSHQLARGRIPCGKHINRLCSS